MSLESSVTFFLLILVATALPGPTMLYVASCGLSHGRKGYLPAGLGVLVADFIYFMITVTGLNAILLASYELFFFIKWLGVFYLLYLGLQLLRDKKSNSLEERVVIADTALFYQAFLKGLLIHLSNPKTILFFGALLPQFINVERPILLQMTVIGLMLLLTQAFMALVYGAMGYRIQQGVKTAGKEGVIKRASGVLFIVAGVWLAMARRE